jgi:hypothetical protein
LRRLEVFILVVVEARGGLVGWCTDFERAGADLRGFMVHGFVGIALGGSVLHGVVDCVWPLGLVGVIAGLGLRAICLFTCGHDTRM